MITLAMIAALEMPPKQYDYPPRREVVVHVASPSVVDEACGKSLEVLLRRLEGKPVTILGCWDGKVIYVRNDLTAKARAKVLRHEYGHVNGWVHE